MFTVSIPSIDIVKHFADLAKHFLSSLPADTSFGGEYEHLRMLADKLDIKKGFVIDMAASDGVDQSCTLGFFKNPDWSGLAIEMEPLKFSRLAFLHVNFPNARLARWRITPHNVGALLKGFEVPPNFSILNLDIDSYDLEVLEAMLKSGFKPNIISMEINEKIPPPLFFNVHYHPDHIWQRDHFYGCSLTAAAQGVCPYGYVLESLQYNNAVFIDADLAKGKISEQSIEVAYDIGYRKRPDRAALFPWNEHFDPLLDCPTDLAIDFINTYFKKYAGKYTLRI